jgi:hypothetical protein
MGSVESEGDNDKRENENDKKNSWGLFPLIMQVSKETCTPIADVLEFPVSFFLYTSTYLIYQNDLKLQEIKKIKR